MDGEQIAALKQQLKDEGYNLYVYSYPGGMCFPSHSHDHDTLHVLLNGSMKITMDGADFILKPGQRFLISANTIHAAEVLGEMPAVVLDATLPHK